MIPSSVRSAVSHLARELAPPQPMRRGTLSERYVKCSKASCGCGRDAEARHGPYYSLTRAVEGKTQTRLLKSEQAALARRQIEAGQEFRQRVEQYREACEEGADQELESSPTASPEEAEKRGSQRRSRQSSSKRSKP